MNKIKLPSFKQSGNVLSVLLGAVAISGALITTVYGLVTGPLSSAARISSKSKAQAELVINAKLVMAQATNPGDGIALPPAFDTAVSPRPTNGGGLPASIGATMLDPWNTPYGYCSWDHGSGPYSAVHLAGAVNYNDKLTVVVVSAGPDKIFQTQCFNDAGGYLTTSGDDIVQRYTFDDAAAASGGTGVWIKGDSGDPNTIRYGGSTKVLVGPSSATLYGDDFQVTGTAVFQGNLSVTGAITFPGNINGIEIGTTTPSSGAFTSLSIDSLTMSASTAALNLTTAQINGTVTLGVAIDNGLVTNLNTDLLNGLDSSFYNNAANLNNSGGAMPLSTLLAFTGDMTVPAASTTTSVVRIRGTPLESPFSYAAGGNLAPLVFDGTRWVNNNAPAGMLGGDIGGTLMSSTVMRLQGRNISATAPSNNRVLAWSGTEWAPMTTQFGASGGTTVGISGLNFLGSASGITAGTCSAGQIPKYSGGTTWACAADNIGGAITLPFDITSATNQRIMTYNAGADVFWGFRGTNNLYIGLNAGRTLDSTGSPGSNNIAYGFDALYSTSSGSDNIALGHYALRNNTTGNRNIAAGFNAQLNSAGASDNIAIGLEAMSGVSSTITGSDNIAIGRHAMRDQISSATQNVVIGTNAALKITTGSRNVAFGANAMTGLTTGNDNIAFGMDALASGPCPPTCNTGNDNIAFGTSAMANNTTGSNNISMGRSALFMNTTGLNNIAVGENALRRTTDASSNIAMGYNAMAYVDFGDLNIALGENALYGNATVDVTASNNIAIGNEAMYTATTPSNNIAVGYRALYEVSSGENNIGIGRSALDNIFSGSYNIGIGDSIMSSAGGVTGVENVAIGHGSMVFTDINSYNTGVGHDVLTWNKGDFNTAVGHRALFGSTSMPFLSGSYNVGIGFEAMLSASTATDNVAVGFSSLRQITTGNENVAVGSQALRSATTSSENVAIGMESMLNTTTSSNVGVGFWALRNSTTGTNNIAIGSAVMAGTGGAITGSDNICLGRDSMVIVTSGSNNICVGNYTLRFLTGGQRNIAMGSSALYSITTGNDSIGIGWGAADAATSSSDNIGIGMNSLSSTTTGNANIGIGSSAIFGNVTGNDNIALGYQAVNRSDSSNNIGIGSRAVASATGTTSVNNIGIGFRTMDNMSSGSGNVMLGSDAGRLVSSASGNVILGAGSFLSNANINNVIIGPLSFTANPNDNMILIGMANDPPSAGVNNYLRIATIGAGNVFTGDMATGNMTLKGTLTAPSDRRLKQDIEPLGRMVDKVRQLRAVTYKWKPDFKKDEHTYIGFIAQEIQKILPEVVFEAAHPVKSDETILTVSYEQLAPIVAKAIQEQQVEIEALRARVEVLKTRAKALQQSKEKAKQ